jgi:hypothetical protein
MATCWVLKIARQPYYRWLAHSVTEAELAAAHRTNALFDAHSEDPELGYRFLVDEAREAGEQMAARTAWRICSERGWWSAFGKKRGKKARSPARRSMATSAPWSMTRAGSGKSSPRMPRTGPLPDRPRAF